MKRKREQTNYQKKINCLKSLLYVSIPFCIVCIVMIFLYWQQGYYPFGNNSLATMDANIQYLDFFAYLKDVMSGENSISYTFSKTMGGTNIAVFSYYLSSPFNLLLFFFSNEKIILFFNCVVVLKLGTAASTMAFFLRERMAKKLNACLVWLLSVSYALMQYNIAQSSNIMWLDGVYMLPLMLLGVYRIIIGEKKTCLLVFATGLAILFNWYSAGINCLFTMVWFVLEWLLNLSKYKPVLTKTIKTIMNYAVQMIFGVVLSAGLFLPTMLSLIFGGRGQVDRSIFENTLNASIVNIIQNFTLGSTSTYGSVSLYCGSFALLGCICFFVSTKISRDKKTKVGWVLFFSLLIFYWQPLFAIFSLLKDARSYWYRYSYVTIFLIIFIAALFYSEVSWQSDDKENASTMIWSAMSFDGVLLLFSYIRPIWSMKRVFYTCIFITVIAILSGLFLYIRKRPELNWMRQITAVVLSAFLIMELGYNTKMLMDIYHEENANVYKEYAADQEEQIRLLQEYDSSIYRISQTSTYNMLNNTFLTANYNEALAYNYWSIAGYTSDPDGLQHEFLDKMGYRINENNMCIVNTSILAADSILGVKYILSAYDINGLEKIDSIKKSNGKSLFYNPYVLPMAFTYNVSDSEIGDVSDDYNNPFEYQNILYSTLTGQKISLYSPVIYTTQDEIDSNTTIYTLEIPEGSYAVYGNITWSSFMNATLDINEKYKTSYAQWLSPSVFYIPTSKGDKTSTVTITYEIDAISDVQFYVLDLTALDTAAKIISQNEANDILIENGYAKIEATGSAGEYLYVSIPYDQGWTITLNGERIIPELFEGCMITIPLEEGKNVIEMHYSVPGLKVGIVISGCSLIVLILLMIINRKGILKKR